MTRFYSLATRLLFPLRNPLWEAFIQLLSSFLSPCTNSDFAEPAWGLLWTLALNVSDNDNVHLNIIYIFLMPCLFKQIMNRRQKVQPWQDYKYVYLTTKASSFISSHTWFEFILSGPVTLTVQATLHTVMTSAFCNKGISKKKKGKRERGREERGERRKVGRERRRRKERKQKGVGEWTWQEANAMRHCSAFPIGCGSRGEPHPGGLSLTWGLAGRSLSLLEWLTKSLCVPC